LEKKNPVYAVLNMAHQKQLQILSPSEMTEKFQDEFFHAILNTLQFMVIFINYY